MSAARTGRDLRDEDGMVAGGEVLIVGMLVFLVGLVLVVNAWAVVDAKSTVDAASREVVRALVEADPTHPDLAGASQVLVEDILTAHNVATERLVALDLPTLPEALIRCNPITVRVTVSVPTLRVPFVGGFGGTWDVSSSHTELVDPFRSGLDGSGDCADA